MLARQPTTFEERLLWNSAGVDAEFDQVELEDVRAAIAKHGCICPPTLGDLDYPDHSWEAHPDPDYNKTPDRPRPSCPWQPRPKEETTKERLQRQRELQQIALDSAKQLDAMVDAAEQEVARRKREPPAESVDDYVRRMGYFPPPGYPQRLGFEGRGQGVSFVHYRGQFYKDAAGEEYYAVLRDDGFFNVWRCRDNQPMNLE